jgi:multicomponent Na+:H+ antiporter subunit E
MTMRQHLFMVPRSQKTDTGQVIFGNSITLTPGTITIETEGEEFIVHALNYSPDDDAALADMDRRVTQAETVVSA